MTNTGAQQPTKKNWENLWRNIFLFVSIICAVVFQKMYIFLTDQRFANIRHANIKDFLIYGSIVAFLIILLDLYVHHKLDQKCVDHYINHDKYVTEEARIKRSYTLVKWVYSIVYYIILSAYAAYLLTNSKFLPSWLGGQDYCYDIVRYSIEKIDYYVTAPIKVFYVIQFGKHLGRLIHHVFIKKQGNFYEYALHHALSTILIAFSYSLNQWQIGVAILIIHDLSDVFLIIGRGTRDYKNYIGIRKYVDIVNYFGATAWVSGRILALGFLTIIVMNNTKKLFDLDPQIREVLILPGFSFGIMLCSLFLLQVFWTYHVFSGYLSATKPKLISDSGYVPGNQQVQQPSQKKFETPID